MRLYAILEAFLGTLFILLPQPGLFRGYFVLMTRAGLLWGEEKEWRSASSVVHLFLGVFLLLLSAWTWALA